MSTEAHKLIGISLSKIAQSRASRSGVSLHKNLLVATVLHKARYIFMEEAYQIVHGNASAFNSTDFNFKFNTPSTNLDQQTDKSSSSSSSNEHLEDAAKDPVDNELVNELEIVDNEWRSANDRVKTTDNNDTTDTNNHPPTHKNSSPTSYQAHIELTYLNLDKYSNTNNTAKPETTSENNLKRRHSEWEVEEAVLSILPKRSKSYSSLDAANVYDETTPSDHDLTFLDDSDTDFLSEPNNVNDEKLMGPSMEIDRLSSLVSIFSFANLTEMSGMCDDNDSSVKGITPDQCSAQAKDNSDVLQPVPPFLAMTV